MEYLIDGMCSPLYVGNGLIQPSVEIHTKGPSVIEFTGSEQVQPDPVLETPVFHHILHYTGYNGYIACELSP